MQPNVCNICGERHWAYQAHRFKGEPRPADRKPTTRVGSGPAAPPPLKPSGEAREPATANRELHAYLAADKAKKAKYMRDYRAKKREGAELD